MTGGSIMRRINGEKFGRRSLRLDATYCVVLGAAVALFSGQVVGLNNDRLVDPAGLEPTTDAV